MSTVAALTPTVRIPSRSIRVRISSITYPSGEVVTSTYNAQGLPDSLAGDDDYVEDASFNALGQTRRLDLGNTLELWYDYYSASQNNNRLQSILVTDGETDLLDLAYHYDSVGNILLITDTVNSGQVQTFEYDELDRLIDAATSGGGAGSFNMEYEYDILGNIDSKDDDGTVYSYSYGDSDHVHAVTSVTAKAGGISSISSSGWSYQYDSNGNMTYRSDATGSYSQTFNVENRLVMVTDTQTLSVTEFFYDGDGNRVLTVYPDESKTAYPGEHYEEHFSMVDESDTLQPGSSGTDSYVDQENAGTNYGSSSTMLVADHVPEKGEPSQLKHFLLQFDLSDIPEEATVDEAVLTLYCAKSESETERTVNFDRVTSSWTESGVTWNNKPSSFSGGSAISIDIDSTEPAYYTVSLTSLVQGWVDGTWTNYGVMAKMSLSGKGYDIGYCVSSDGETSSQRPKLEVDWRIEDTQTSYYHLGGQRVALRVEEGAEDDVYWLHTDHLGSTSLLSDEGGDLELGTTTRFLPFGDYRTEPDSDLTDKGFTGHVQQDEIGLTFMRARFYVSSVGRFASADTIVPSPANPQSWNRFSYVNNNPLKYRDPSGHALECGLLGEDCGGESPAPVPLPPVCSESSWCLPVPGPFGITIVHVPGEPGIDVSETRARGGRALSQIGLGLDVVELGLSSLGVLGESAALAVGAVGGPGGAILAWLVERTGTDAAETVVGNVTLAVNVWADIGGGYTYIDYDTFELVIGQATLVNIAEQGVDWAIPSSPEVDLASNLTMLGYDAGYLSGLVPNFLEYRVPLLPPITWLPFTGGYFVYYHPIEGTVDNQ